MGRQIINTKRKGLSPRTILRLVILAILLVALAIGTFFWLHGHAAVTAFLFWADRLTPQGTSST